MSTIVEVIRPEPRQITITRPPQPYMYIQKDYGPKGDPGQDGTNGTDGDPGAIPPSTLAARPAASSVPPGTLHYATDSSTPVSISTGTAWVSPPVPSIYHDHVVDPTNDLTTTIAALNLFYRIGDLETGDKPWPGGLARVSVYGLIENNTGHVLGSTDSVTIQKSTDSGASWTGTQINIFFGFRQTVGGTAWVPEQPIIGIDDTLAAGTTVRFRVVVSRLITGTTPVDVSWNDVDRALIVEALR